MKNRRRLFMAGYVILVFFGTVYFFHKNSSSDNL